MIDLSTALYPDIVFDPTGKAGDSGFKCLTPNSGDVETGFVVPGDACVDPFSDDNEGGFFTIELNFEDFDSGETFTFSVDADPTSINGNPGVGDAGSVGGIEMMGGTVTATFSDESTVVKELFHMAGTQGGSEAVVRANPLPAPGLTISGLGGTTAQVTDANQNLLVTGLPGTQVRIFQSDGRLNIEGVPGGGFDLEPFEANEAIGGVWDYTATIGEDNTVTVPVLLRASDKADGAGNGGLNHFMAVMEGDFVGRTSNRVVMELQAPSTATLIEGWNMVGVSFDVNDPNYLAIFGDASPTQAPYLWDNGNYVQATEMGAGIGYWIDVENAGEVSILGTEISSVTIEVTSGWNLVSGPSCIFNISDATDPDGIIIPGNLYRFDGSYVATASLTPNVGYWLEVTDDGTLTFDCNSEVELSVEQTSDDTTPHAEFGIVRVSDEKGRQQELFYGNELSDKHVKRQYNMPPLANRGFDARYVDNSRLMEGETGVIKVRGADFPISFEIVKSSSNQLGMLTIEALAGDKVIDTFQALEGSEVVISDERITALRIGKDAIELQSLPESFALTGNFPNPFNPTTNIVFDLPEDANMQVAIYDLLGRQVMLLDSIEMAAGATRQLQIDASSLASGTYLYKVQARMASGIEESTGRMTLLK